MAQGRDERSVQLLVLCSESGWGSGPGMCGDRLLSVKDTLISRATGPRRRRLVLFFLGDIRAHCIQYEYMYL